MRAKTERTIKVLWDTVGPIIVLHAGRMRKLLQGRRT